MKATPTCPDHETLELLRDGKVPKGDRGDLVRHVSQCQNCRAVLKKLMAGHSKTEALKTKPGDSGSSTGGPKSGIKTPAQDAAGQTRTLQPEGTPHQSDATESFGEEWQTYLSSSKKPGSLGRLSHYEILELIGRGGMGVVLKGFDDKLQRVVAIKLLSPALAGSATARKRFVREARAAAAVRDNHAVGIHDVDESGPVPFLVMEFIAGISLEKRLKRDGPMEVAEVVRLGIQIAEGLAAAHKEGLVHRDIKPGNILLENEKDNVKITDFGLARAVDDANLTQSGVISGTPMYMAPEQALGEAVDHRADLFSLGSVLYAMCTGHSPFRATSSMAVIRRVCDEPHEPVRKINPEVPQGLAGIIDKLLTKDRDKRFQSAGAVAESLRGLAHPGSHQRRLHSSEQLAETVEAPKGPGRAQPRPTRRKSRVGLFIGLGAAACVVLAFVALASLVAWRLVFQTVSNDQQIIAPLNETKGSFPAKYETDFVYKAPPSLPFSRENINKRFLEIAGGGRAENAPPDLVAVLGDDNWLLPYGASGSWMGHSSDGKQIAIAVNDTIEFFDASTGKHQRTLTEIGGRTLTAAFRPNFGQLAVVPGGDANNAIVLIDVADGREIMAFRGSKWPVNTVAFAPPDGKMLVSVGGDSEKNGEAIIWDVATGKKVQELVGHSAHIRGAAFAPRGNLVATASDDLSVRVWDRTSGKLVRSLPSVPKGPTYGLAFSGDGAMLAVGNYSQTRIWSTSNWMPVGYQPWAYGGEWLAFRGQSQKLMATKQVKPPKPGTKISFGFGVYDIPNWQTTFPNTARPISNPALFSFSPNLDQLMVIEADPLPFVFGAGRFFIDEAVTLVPAEAPKVRGVQALGISSDGRYLAAIKVDEGQIWDLQVGKPIVNLVGPLDAPMNFATFSPNGKLLATSTTAKPKSGKESGSLMLWNTTTGLVEKVLRGDRAGAFVSFSPDSKIVYGAGLDGKPKRWSTEDGTLIAGSWGQEIKAVTTMAASPDGAWVATGGTDKAVHVLDAKTGLVVKTFRLDHAVNAVRFSNDAKALAYTATVTKGRDESGERRLWEVPSWKELPRPAPTKTTTTSFAIHPNRRLVASALHDGTVQLNEDHLGDQQTHFFGPGPFGKEAKRIVFTPDGNFLAGAGENGTISIFRLPAAGALGASQPAAAKPPRTSNLKGWGTAYDPDGDCFFVPTAGNVNIIVPPGTHDLSHTAGNAKTNAPRILQEKEGDFSLQVRINSFGKSSPVNPSKGVGGQIAAGLLIWVADRHFMRFEKVGQGGSKTYSVKAITTVKGSSSIALNKTLPTGNEDTYLRVTRKGDLLTFEMKYVGEPTWKLLDRAHLTMPAKVKVGVHAVNTTSNVFSPQFQELTLSTVSKSPPAVVPPPGQLFVKDSIMPSWGQVVDPDGDCSFGLDFANNMTLTIAVPMVAHDLTTNPAFNRQNAPRVMQEVVGDFGAQTKVLPFNGPFSIASTTSGPPVIGSGLLIWQDEHNFVRWERFVDKAGAGITLEHHQTGKQVFTKSWPITDEVTTLRVERRAGQLVALMLTGAEKTWKTMYTLSVAFPENLKVGVHAINTTTAEFSPQLQGFSLNKFAKKPPPPVKNPVVVTRPPPGTIALLPLVNAQELGKKPSPADAFKRGDISKNVLGKLGTGNEDAPKELVAVLGRAGDPQVVSLAISGDGSRLATAGWRDTKALLFDLAGGKVLKTIQAANKAIDMVALSADGKTLAAAGSTANSVQLFDTGTGETKSTFSAVTNLVLETVFSPDSKLIAVGDNGGNVKLCEILNAKEQLFKPALTQINRMAFSPDGKFLACSGRAGKDYAIIVMEVATGKMDGPLSGHANVVLGLAWHPTGQKLASADNSGSIRLWDLAAMNQIQQWESDGFQVHGLAWHPSGEFLASSNHTGGTITIWDMRETARRHRGIYLFPPSAASKSVANANNDILFTPEGRYLIAGNSDGTISVLRLAELGKLIK